MSNLSYEIREIPDATDGLRLELFVGERRIAFARASQAALDEMAQELGLQRDQIAAALRVSLEDFLEDRLDKVMVSDLIEDPQRPLRFISRYTYRDVNDIDTGLVW